MKVRSLNNRGFTIIELLLIMLTMVTLMKVLLPNMKGMQSEGALSKVDEELVTLKTAITSYWRNHNAYPGNITSDLVNTTPQLLSAPLKDPFNTDNGTYGYETGNDPSFGPWFAVYSKGPRGDTTAVDFESANRRLRFGGSGRVISNAPVVKF